MEIKAVIPSDIITVLSYQRSIFVRLNKQTVSILTVKQRLAI